MSEVELKSLSGVKITMSEIELKSLSGVQITVSEAEFKSDYKLLKQIYSRTMNYF